MPRRRGKRVRRDLYGASLSRLSVYPQAGGPGEGRPEPPEPGDVLRVRIQSLDEDGAGVGFYRGYRVVVDGASPGETVEALVERVHKRTIYAKVKGEG